MDRQRWNLEIGGQDHLLFGGCDLVELAQCHGTPLHVVDAARLRQNVETFRRAFISRGPGAGVFYSYKTNCVPGVLALLHEAGCGAEVASPYEYWLASVLGVAPESVIYNGVNRSVEDFERAIQDRVHLINVDSASEAVRLAAAAASAPAPVRVGLRIDPRVGWKAHFGVQTRSPQLVDLVDALKRSHRIVVSAIHAHIGSSVCDVDVYERAIDRIAELVAGLQRDASLAIDTLDLGGGFGASTVKRFTARDAAFYRLFNRPPRSPGQESCASIDQFAETIVATAGRAFARHGLPQPRLVLEPGRAITGSAQVLLVTVKDVKTRANGERFALTDGGMQNIAFPLSYEYHHCFVASRASAASTERWFVTGPLCSAEDLLYRNWPLPPLEAGDVLAIMDAGAYFTSFANNFSYPRPAVVLASNGSARVLRARETFQDMKGVSADTC